MGESVTSFVDRVTGTGVQLSLKRNITRRILNGIAETKGKVSIPTLSCVLAEYPDYKQAMIDVYHGIFGLNKYVNDIPDDVKATQGALFEGLCFMFDMNTGSNQGIVSLNGALAGGEEVQIDSKLEKKVMECNRIGTYHSYRYDYAYTVAEGCYVNFERVISSVKCVKHRTVIDDDNIVLVPLVSVVALADIFKSQLDRGNILAVKTVLGNGEVKARVISDNDTHLSHYCDSASACIGLKTEYHTLDGVIYAPVLGAPSTTAMKTRIELMNLDSLNLISSYSQCATLGVQKCVNPVETLFKEQVILQTLAQMRVYEPDRYLQFVEKISDNPVLGDMLNGDINTRALSNYLHTITRGKVNELLKRVPGAEEAFNKRMSLISQGGNETVVSSDIPRALREGIIKVIWRKENGLYASSVCTNNRDILKAVYGKDYYSVYESIGVRISSAVEDMTDVGLPIEEACRYYGFSANIANKVKELVKQGSLKEDAFYEALGKKKRAPSVKKPGIVTARTLQAYLSGGYSAEESTTPKSSDYYVSIDTNRIIRAELIK